MNEDPSRSRIPAFFRHQSAHFEGARIFGTAEAWAAPVAVLESEVGFGEEVWLPSVPDTLLAVRLAGSTVSYEVGAGRRSGPGRAFALQLAGLPNRFRATGYIRFAQVYLPDQLLRRAADGLGVPALAGSLRDDLIFRSDPALEERLQVLVRRASDAAQPPSMLEVEGLTLLLLDRLFRLHGRGGTLPAKGGLAPWQVRRVMDYLQDNLTSAVLLGDLAALVNLSPHHFCRAFKASTGLPPHRMHTRMRLERVQELLLKTDLSVGEVAAAVGYDEPGHLARSFRKETGLSPQQYRRERRS